ncbi:Phosphoethanolamine transferase for glucans (OPG), alkaline phosphatase superfamily [Dialister histaminiformans]|uniref:Phosphoethanolamine transferase for glucans (OPG), alkaline phosphatase superfamily n=1 Tax=Allisonella histaminiformans TaxID=209880 RepID=A0A1G5WAF1_9FIRM|nr:sulfatase-like hydrolase/transferase [Allisonella histaminiformans]SDA55088.1 Phosphoethanolamine transferase for glucans (OPG), alkaline phosphatase superfamily [Allisonella histaminiformans]
MGKKWNFEIWAGIEALILQVITFAWFYFCGIGRILAWHNSMRDFAMGLVILILGQVIVKKHLLSQLWAPAGGIYLLMISIYPYVIGTSMHGWHADFDLVNPYYLSALSVGIVLTLLAAAGQKNKKVRPAATGIIALSVIFFSVSAISYLVYFFIYHNMFPAEDMIPVIMTSWQETVGFMTTHFDTAKLAGLGLVALLIIVGGLFMGWFSTGKEKKVSPVMPSMIWSGKTRTIFIVLILIMAGLTIRRWVPRCYPLYELKLARRYQASIIKAEKSHEENYKKLQITDKQGKPLQGTVILIIGESECRDRMTAFNPALTDDSTPWLSRMAKSNQAILYKKAYSNFPATALALEQVLTSENQYHDQSFSDAVSILDVANKAGYQTWWLGNHNRMANGTAAYGLVAEEAKHKLWTNPAPQDDKALLDLLKKVPKEGNNFVIIHMYGSHTRYMDRYPAGYPEVHNSTKDSVVQYDTSVKYTDDIMSRIFDYAEKNLNLKALIYTSDHGEDMVNGHGEGGFTFAMVHTPVFFYFSPEYRKDYPQLVSNVEKHKDEFFTNDLMFDSLSSILRAGNNYQNAQYDITDSSYSLPEDKALTVHGKHKVMEDPALKK